MGLYTSIVIVPSDRTWRPTANDLIRIADHLGVRTVEILCLYRGPLFWEVEPRTVRTVIRCSVDSVMSYIDDAGEGSALLGFEYGPWARSYSEVMEKLPADLTRGYVPWDVAIYYGRCSIPDVAQEHTAAEANFMLKIGGDGCPDDMDAYLQAARSRAPLRTFVAFLQTITKCDCETFITLF